MSLPPLTDRPQDISGLQELARIARVSVQTLCNWRSRDLSFPKPYCELRMGRIYDASEFRAWLERRRLSDHADPEEILR